MIKKLIPVTALGVLLALTGCGAKDDQPVTTPAAPSPHDDGGYGVWLDADDENDPDCDREDRKRNEIPDCGFRHDGTFYTWGWVDAGRTTPPNGWRPDSERIGQIAKLPPTKPKVGTPAPRPTKPAASPRRSSPSKSVTTRAR
jgi:hypothetical protein